jgi:hypothetical protein
LVTRAESPTTLRRRTLRASVDVSLLLGVAVFGSASVVACGPPELSCAETATCPPNLQPDSGADVSIDTGEIDMSSPGTDGTTDDSSTDVMVEALIDLRAHEDADAGWPRADAATDTHPVTDATSEADACDPGMAKSPVESACLISERYGVFVSPHGSDSTGAGTRMAPFKTIARASQTAKGDVMRVYACDDGTGYADALTIDATLDGISLFGGFECAAWTYAVTRRARVRPATGVALVVRGLTVGLTVEDFEFNAADAAIGGSSMGAIVDSAVNVVLRGVKVIAGKGGGGADGAEGAKGADAPRVELAQQGSSARCPAPGSQQNGGSWGSPTICGSRGGNGGQANQGLGGTNGVGGIPTTGITTPNIGTGGGPGEDGAKGSDGNPGAPGALNSAVGSFAATGYAVAPAGGDGTVGLTAQGGGGGGASSASGVCIGASGGAGGMGGCGGGPGMGGASAGASVALLSWMSSLTLERCELISVDGGAGGKGGNGGVGGEGKAGGAGGAAYGDADAGSDAGVGLGKGGNGGPGGKGGNGGSGAGGNGGPSYALVYRGSAPTKLNGTSLVHGAGGAKGAGGSVENAKAPDGVVGTAGEEFAVQ